MSHTLQKKDRCANKPKFTALQPPSWGPKETPPFPELPALPGELPRSKKLRFPPELLGCTETHPETLNPSSSFAALKPLSAAGNSTLVTPDENLAEGKAKY